MSRPQRAADARRYDIVLFGATGYTGGLVAAYLLQQRSGARIALAGRNRDKLQALTASLGLDVPVLIADVEQPDTLAAIAQQTNVVCTTVGPYARHGEPLVAACAEHGTDYCDLTGEVPWVRRMLDKYEARAQVSGARIIPSCGFDSIPSDLGVLVLQAAAQRMHGVACDRVLLGVRELRGGISGGTMASIVGVVMEAGRDPEVRAWLADAYSLNPAAERSGPDSGRVRGVAWEPEFGAWTAPFLMGSVNERVVRRSVALRGHPYGREFSYREAWYYPKGAVGLARAIGATAGLVGLMAGSSVPPLRALLQRSVWPAPGEGPSPEARASGFFDLTLFGSGTTHSGAGFRLCADVHGDGDPGYAATSRMLGEAALSLALDPRLTDGGFLTPAVALGQRLVERLRTAGVTIDVRDSAGTVA